MSENNELTKNVTGWLHTMLSTPGMVNVDASQAENVLASKQWLSDVNNDKLLVTEAPEEPEEPAPQN